MVDWKDKRAVWMVQELRGEVLETLYLYYDRDEAEKRRASILNDEPKADIVVLEAYISGKVD